MANPFMSLCAKRRGIFALVAKIHSKNKSKTNVKQKKQNCLTIIGKAIITELHENRKKGWFCRQIHVNFTEIETFIV
ncbi:uncharacterized protein OCT59_011996 [Rhizophagus irregularis]|uniref:uncharacterized protein n=1 Tax=Rhizophagus irregularis TaxID=588596 RepID=UPI0019E770B8|nr:hypothetical protein OCT59_011996 [Rhizophagus irregularis]GET64567.1 hypothetical protein RIR_jg7300.t1 [Rhizophagus irregularis DAOM 181602=DAOM 197198]